MAAIINGIAVFVMPGFATLNTNIGRMVTVKAPQMWHFFIFCFKKLPFLPCIRYIFTLKWTIYPIKSYLCSPNFEEIPSIFGEINYYSPFKFVNFDRQTRNSGN